MHRILWMDSGIWPLGLWITRRQAARRRGAGKEK